MNGRDFVRQIRLVVRDAALDSTLQLLERPPGRRPAQHLLQLSEWFNHLPTEQKEFVKRALAEAVDDAVFGFLAVLDGVRPIDMPESGGQLKLNYESGREVQLLNDPDKEYLHDILKEETDS